MNGRVGGWVGGWVAYLLSCLGFGVVPGVISREVSVPTGLVAAVFQGLHFVEGEGGEGDGLDAVGELAVDAGAGCWVWVWWVGDSR